MKVAVLGAGFSGMLAAYLLEKEGIDVTIYEKQEYIGGHCRTLSSKDVYTELGTVFSFSEQIKALLIELQVDYSERITHRNFIDENFQSVEHISREKVKELMNEFHKLKTILESYSESLDTINYGYIHEDLMMPLCKFLRKYDLHLICQVITPYLSAFGFGNICQVQAYYAFKVFNADTIYSFISGDKLLFIDKGTSELIKQLGQNISDIRHSIEVTNIEVVGDKVKVDTLFSSDLYDKVLITTKLPRDVIKDQLYNELMKKIDTNPYFTCAYEVSNSSLATTYYKTNLGQKNKIQFFHTTRQNKRTILVAYAYGTVNKEVINDITEDLKKSGIITKHLITVKQWYIFPHLKDHNLSQHFYKDISERQKVSRICLIGSLVSEPAIDNLYISVKKTVQDLLESSL